MAIAPGFDHSLFVQPKGAHNWVLARVKKRDEGPPEYASREMWRLRPGRFSLAPGDQVLSLVGEHGAGKTWLLRYLAEYDRTVSPQAAFLDLEARFHIEDPGQYVAAVQSQLAGYEPARDILLLDAVPRQIDEHLRALEDAVLRPHLARHNSLVIMALEHPSQVCWRAPSLRGGNSFQLPPFDEGQTNRQFQRLQERELVREDCTIGEVLHGGRGLPLLNHLLATRQRTVALEVLLQHWFSRIPPGDDELVQHYLVAVCPLDILEHGSIQKMLEVYYHCQPDAAGYPAHPGGVRNVLQKYWLARPAPGVPGRIALVGSVRHAAEELLKIKDPALYTVLNEMATVLRGGQP